MSTVTWEAATAAHKQRNQIRRNTIAFEVRPQRLNKPVGARTFKVSLEFPEGYEDQNRG